MIIAVSLSKDNEEKIQELKKEIASIRNESQIAALKAQIEELKQQKINPQISREQSMTYMKGYDEEFERLKEDEIKRSKKNKKNKILSLISAIITIPLTLLGMYFIFINTDLKNLIDKEIDKEFVQIFYLILGIVFALIEISNIINLIKTIFIDPNIILDDTLSNLSLTAKEHILDPKGSVIREKYGTNKWNAVTNT